MAGTRKLVIEIAGDASGAVTAFNKTEGAADSFGKKAGAVFAGIGAAYATREIVDFAKDSISAFTEAEQEQAKLSDAFAKFPQLAGGNIKALQDLNTALAQKTRFDDDATAAAEANLAQFGLTQDQLTKIIPLVQDYAARTGKDLATASTDVGKAMLGQARALKEVGIKFEDTGSAAGNFDELMGALKKQVGGFAESEGKTAAGQAEILGNQFKELQEKVGSVLLPVLLKLSDILIKIVTFLMDNQPVFIALVSVVGVGLVTAFGAWAVAAFTAEGSMLPLVAAVVGVTAVVALLVAGVIYAYNNFDWFRTTVDTVASFLTDVVWPAFQTGYEVLSTLVSAYLAPLRWAISNIGDVISAVQTIWSSAWGAIGGAVQAVWDHTIGPVLDFIWDKIEKILDGLYAIGIGEGTVTGSMLPIKGTPSSAPPKGFAVGGYVDAPIGQAVPAIVHGGEYVLTADQVSGIRGGSSMVASAAPNVTNVYVTATPGTDKVGLAQEIMELLEHGNRNGVRPGAATVAAFSGA